MLRLARNAFIITVEKHFTMFMDIEFYEDGEHFRAQPDLRLGADIFTSYVDFLMPPTTDNLYFPVIHSPLISTK